MLKVVCMFKNDFVKLISTSDSLLDNTRTEGTRQKCHLSWRLLKAIKSLRFGEEILQRCRLFVQDLEENCQPLQKHKAPKVELQREI